MHPQQPTNVDIPVPIKPTPEPDRTDRHGMPVNDTSAHISPVSNLPAKSPATRELRKSPAVPEVVRRASNKPKFSRLATDCSDEILDFDDVSTARRPTPPSSLGKRKKPDSPPKPVEELRAPRPYKRLVGTILSSAMSYSSCNRGLLLARPK